MRGSREEEETDIVLAVDYEGPYEAAHRVTIVLIVVAVIVGLAAWRLTGDHFAYAICFAVVVFFFGASKVGGKRSFVLRNRDFFTIGGEVNRPVSWSSVESVSISGSGALVRLKGGRQRTLSLPFLDPVVRLHAIERFIRCLDLFRAEGPLRLPEVRSVGRKEGVLQLRPLDRSDRELWIALSTEEGNHGSQLYGPSSRELAGQVFDLALGRYQAGNESWRFAIMVDGTSAGFVSLEIHDLILRQANLGIDLLPDFRNRGFGTEAIRLLLDHFSAHSNLTKVTASCFSDNLPCKRTLEKSGMRYVGRLERFWRKDGVWKTGEHFEYEFSGTAVSST